MKEAYIIDAIRTPVGKFGGSLATVRPDDMAALVMKTIIDRNKGIDPAAIDDVIFGNANQAGEDNRNVARMSLLLAGIPFTVPGVTVNRLCASGLEATAQAARAIQLGDGDLYLAGGVESMTRAPFVMAKSDKPFGREVEIYDTSIGWRFANPEMEKVFGTEGMGQTAENLVEMYDISREDQDIFAFNSQMKAKTAMESGRLRKEIVPVEIPQRKGEPIIFDHDEFIRPESTLEALAKLRPAFKKDGSVTAGNSSGINDGAAAILLASEEAVQKYNLVPRAKFITSAAVGVEPRIMGIGPVNATKKVMQKSGLSLDQMDVIELNEAFASQSLAVLRELNISPDDTRVNPNGGAIAIGHPLGMTGARLITTALYELEERQAKYALCTLCIGVGQGMAAIIERV